MKDKFALPPLINFLRRLHAFIGVFVGPFIILVSFTGALYGVSFLIEDFYYKDILFVKKSNEFSKPLSMQIQKANEVIGDSSKLLAIRPGLDKKSASRILYTNSNLRSSEYRTIFINPVTLEVTGDLITYGSSGALPMRRTVDLLHRDLLLGESGRWYSELAASWLWVTAVTGIILYLRKRKKSDYNSYQRLLKKHTSLGIFCLGGLVMLSITGLTWSEYAGENISKIRSAMSWHTPSVHKLLPKSTPGLSESSKVKTADQILSTARENGIDSLKIEIWPAANYHEAWQVSEIDRSYPSNVDSVAINPWDLSVVGKATFQDFPLMAKLTRWGIDLHMGSLFGVANQILLILTALGIATLGVTGYWLWFKKNGWKRAFKSHITLWHELKNQPQGNFIVLIALIVVSGVMFPILLVSLIIYSVFELVLKKIISYRN